MANEPVGDKSVGDKPIENEPVGGAPCGDWISVALRLKESPQGAPPTVVGVGPTVVGVTPNIIRASLSRYARSLYPGPYGENKNAKPSQTTSPNNQLPKQAHVAGYK